MPKKLLILAVLALFLFGSIGCESDSPGERLGKNINKTIENANDRSQ